MKKIGITLGDPNGISPEIIIKALNILDIPVDNILLIANKRIFEEYENRYNLILEKKYNIIEVEYKSSQIHPGEQTSQAGDFSYNCLVKACELVKNKQIDSIVTAPISKYSMHLAGYDFSGQTEILEHFLSRDNQKAEMLFVCGNFSVFLLTRHEALKNVPALIKKEYIEEKVQRLNYALKNQLGNKNPKFSICALNPHAGENGIFGDEEIKEIIPAVKFLTDNGINIKGPFPSDTLFTNINDKNRYDCYIALYHDQGLIPIKLTQRNNCVNVTIGLDVIRTSPAHGTAFDIAGLNIANPDSMINAIKLALKY